MMQTNQPRRGLEEKAAPDMESRNHAEGSNVIDATKVSSGKDITKVLDFFRYTPATGSSSLDAALATGVLRNSVTWYISYLEDEGLLRVVCIQPDRSTGFRAKHYSADPALWPQVDAPAAPQYPSLFNEEDLL